MKKSTLPPRPTSQVTSTWATATTAAIAAVLLASCASTGAPERPSPYPSPEAADSLPLGIDPRAVVACAEHTKTFTGDVDTAYEDCLDEAINVLSAVAFNEKYDELISADDPRYVARPLPSRTSTPAPLPTHAHSSMIEVTLEGTGAQFTWSTEDGSIHQTTGDGPVVFLLPNRQGVLVNASVFAYRDANATCRAMADGAVVVENTQGGQTYASCTFSLPFVGK